MGYNFILSESEKREILNKHNSYKNFLNEESVAPSVMDIQLKLIKLGYENLLGTGKADGKFGKYTCNAILSALTSLKQKQSEGTPKVEEPKGEEPKKDESGKIPGKIYPLGNEAGDAGIDVTN